MVPVSRTAVAILPSSCPTPVPGPGPSGREPPWRRGGLPSARTAQSPGDLLMGQRDGRAGERPARSDTRHTRSDTRVISSLHHSASPPFRPRAPCESPSSHPCGRPNLSPAGAAVLRSGNDGPCATLRPCPLGGRGQAWRAHEGGRLVDGRAGLGKSPDVATSSPAKDGLGGLRYACVQGKCRNSETAVIRRPPDRCHCGGSFGSAR